MKVYVSLANVFFFLFFQHSGYCVTVFETQKECELQTGKQCGFNTCDDIPVGKRFEEVCGKDFQEGWIPNNQHMLEEHSKEISVLTHNCQSSNECPNESICDVSRPSYATPRGTEYGVAMGDALCHHQCTVDTDCQSRGYGKCISKQLFEGDVAQVVNFCEEPIQR